MYYEEWSKSRELARTFTSNFPARENSRAEENNESESLRRPARLGGMLGFKVGRSLVKPGELARTRVNFLMTKLRGTVAKSL